MNFCLQGDGPITDGGGGGGWGGGGGGGGGSCQRKLTRVVLQSA